MMTTRLFVINVLRVCTLLYYTCIVSIISSRNVKGENVKARCVLEMCACDVYLCASHVLCWNGDLTWNMNEFSRPT